MGDEIIFLLEDDENDASFIKTCLKKFTKDENIFHFENGADLLEYVSESKINNNRLPGLFLMDLKTPKINGLQVLQQLKSDERTKSIPVIIMTSSQEEKDLKDSYAFGANSFVVKPIDFKVFEKTIEAVGNYWLNVNRA